MNIFSKDKTNILRTGTPQYNPANILKPQELSVLIHKIGHEIGNPLTAIISLSSIIDRLVEDSSTLNKEIANKISSYSNSITNESWRINNHSERLVMLLSQKAGNLYLLNFSDVLNHAIKKYQLRNKGKNVELVYSTTAKTPPQVFFDNDQLIILLSELIGNAVNFQNYDNKSSETKIIAQIESNKSESTLKLSNKINEPLPFELDDIFKPYITKYQDKKHLGLGLTMCLAILKKFKGQIKALESKIDNDLYFTIELTLPNTEYADS